MGGTRAGCFKGGRLFLSGGEIRTGCFTVEEEPEHAVSQGKVVPQRDWGGARAGCFTVGVGRNQSRLFSQWMEPEQTVSRGGEEPEQDVSQWTEQGSIKGYHLLRLDEIKGHVWR